PCGGHGARPRDHSGEELDQQPQSEALGATERGKKSTRRPLVESRRLVARCALCVNEPPSRETLAALQRRAYAAFGDRARRHVEDHWAWIAARQRDYERVGAQSAIGSAPGNHPLASAEEVA